MWIYYVLLAVSAIIFSSQFLITKQYQKLSGTGYLSTVRLMFFAYFTVAVFFLVKGSLSFGRFNFGFSFFTFALTLAVAIISLLCVYVGVQVLSVGSVGVYSAFMMLGSLMLPSAVGIIFFKESVSVPKIIALVLMLVSVLFSVKSDKNSKMNLKAILFYIAIFFLNGMVGVLFTIHQNRPDLTALPLVGENGVPSVNNDLFMCWYGISMVLLCTLIFLVDYTKKTMHKNTSITDTAHESSEITTVAKTRTKTNVKTATYLILLAVSYGICNGLGNYFIALGTQSGALGASVTFPIVNGGTILFSAVLGAAIYKEKIKLNSAIGLALAIVSTVLFMFA